MMATAREEPVKNLTDTKAVAARYRTPSIGLHPRIILLDHLVWLLYTPTSDRPHALHHDTLAVPALVMGV